MDAVRLLRTAHALAAGRLPQERRASSRSALDDPAALHPRVAALEAALATEERRRPSAASHELVARAHRGDGAAGRAASRSSPRVPTRSWGELHGLYTERARPAGRRSSSGCARPSRSASSRSAPICGRLLHEVGHHVDYTAAATAGVVSHARASTSASRACSISWCPRPEESRRCRQWRNTRSYRPTNGCGDSPAPPTSSPRRSAAVTTRCCRAGRTAKNWAAKEAICHLRDVEEMFTGAVRDDPGDGQSEARVRSHHAGSLGRGAAVSPERRAARAGRVPRAARRGARPARARSHPEQWKRAGIHATRGPITINDFVTLDGVARRQPPGSAQAGARRARSDAKIYSRATSSGPGRGGERAERDRPAGRRVSLEHGEAHRGRSRAGRPVSHELPARRSVWAAAGFRVPHARDPATASSGGSAESSVAPRRPRRVGPNGRHRLPRATPPVSRWRGRPGARSRSRRPRRCQRTPSDVTPGERGDAAQARRTESGTPADEPHPGPAAASGNNSDLQVVHGHPRFLEIPAGRGREEWPDGRSRRIASNSGAPTTQRRTPRVGS